MSADRRRIHRLGGLEPVGRLVGAAGAGAPEALVRVVRAWPAAAGELVAREAWPARIGRDGTVTVHCRSAVWASELIHLTTRLTAALESAGAGPVAGLRFVVGSVPERPPPPPEVSRRAVSEGEAAAVRGWASAVRDPALRAVVEQAALASVARRAEGVPGAGSDSPIC
jgi:hypothetical protein